MRSRLVLANCLIWSRLSRLSEKCADEAAKFGSELVVSGSDFQAAEHPLDTVALLIERPVMRDLHAVIGSATDDDLNAASLEIGANGVSVVTPVG